MSSKMKLKLVPASLNVVGEEHLTSMCPGDIIMIDPLSALRSMIESDFCAVLACPWCGMPGLITPSQYGGTEPIMCGSDSCSCRFRIKDNCNFECLPAS
jgi:hypothetical protein